MRNESSTMAGEPATVWSPTGTRIAAGKPTDDQAIKINKFSGAARLPWQATRLDVYRHKQS